MDQKILTIAVPTWNRAVILEISLKALLANILEVKEDIQLIISDNGSTDHTVSVVESLLNDYPGIDVVFYKQQENTGYYGNFRKCRELATGKYFWLLSDNEMILPGSLVNILKELKLTSDAGLIYLNNLPSGYPLVNRKLSFDRLFEERNYKLTFISSCIMLNNKMLDEQIFNEFKGNSFLGFALLVNSRRFSNSAKEISGDIYQSIPTVVSFNVFKCWTTDIFQCYKFILSENLFPENMVTLMQEYTLKYVLKDHLLHYRMYNSYYGSDLGSFDLNYRLLSDYYGNLINFKQLKQIRETSRPLLFYRFYLKKTQNKTRKILSKMKK
jgi:glycosyltransferase involved in cell wall biosynthesis